MSREGQDWHLAPREPSNASGVSRYLERENLSLVVQIVGVPQHLLLMNPERFRYCFHSRNPGEDAGDPDRPTHNARLLRDWTGKTSDILMENRRV